MTLPALPSAASLTTPEQIAEAGVQVVALAEAATDATARKEIADRWAAMTEYIRRTNRAGVAEAEATLRRLETMVGSALGPAEVGANTALPHAVTHNRRHEFRRMAANPDVVEQVISESTDADPPSRRKVLRAIENANEAAEAKQWAKDYTAEQRARGYDPADDKRRGQIIGGLFGFVIAVERLASICTPADAEWALDGTYAHVAEKATTELNAALDVAAKYRRKT